MTLPALEYGTDGNPRPSRVGWFTLAVAAIPFVFLTVPLLFKLINRLGVRIPLIPNWLVLAALALVGISLFGSFLLGIVCLFQGQGNRRLGFVSIAASLGGYLIYRLILWG